MHGEVDNWYKDSSTAKVGFFFEMHALFAHKSLQITFLPCIRLVRGGNCLRPPTHGDDTVRRHAAGSALEGERAEAVRKAPRFRAVAPSFFAVAQTPARCPSRHHLRGCRKTDAPTKHCTQSANTPPVQWHTMAAHAAKQNRIRGKEDKGGETKKNLPSPTRRSDVERQRIEGDNGFFEGENSPHFDGTVALSERGFTQRQYPSCAVARKGCARRRAK